MKKLYTFFTLMLMSVLTFGQVINEVDADTPGTDAAEFIEIKHDPNTALDGLVVVLFNGNGDISYGAFDLDGKSTDANGFFILANTALVSGDDIDLGTDNALQNGADAVALFTGNATDFPDGTPITSTNLLSGVVYDTNDADDAELLAVIGGVQYNEDENGEKDNQSVQRNTDGTYTVKNSTFRQDNDAATCDLTLTNPGATCDAFTADTDTYTATLTFNNGGLSTYTVTSDSGTVDLSGGDPSSDATGTITVTGISEGTDVVINISNGGVCDLSQTINTPTCEESLALPLYEGFDYSVGSALGDQPNWSNLNSGDEVLVTSGSLSYDGLEDETGNSVEFGQNGADPTIEFTPVNDGAVYASFIFRVTDQSLVTDTTDGGYFAGLANSTTSYDARIWVRPIGDAATSTTFDIGYGFESSSPPFTGNTYNVGDDIFIVMSYDTDTGDVKLWVNPDSDTFSGTAPATTLMATEDPAADAIRQFIIRQDSDGETPDMLLDELRIGTSWASVTPQSLGIGDQNSNSFKLYPNPSTTGLVNINSVNAGEMSVSVFNVLGKNVMVQEITNNTLDVSRLKNGLYLLKISQNNATTTKKLIIK